MIKHCVCRVLQPVVLLLTIINLIQDSIFENYTNTQIAYFWSCVKTSEWSLQWDLIWWKSKTAGHKIQRTHWFIIFFQQKGQIQEEFFKKSSSICNQSPSLDNFSLLAHVIRKVQLEIKESFLVKQDRRHLNNNISCTYLYLFDSVKRSYLCDFNVTSKML